MSQSITAIKNKVFLSGKIPSLELITQKKKNRFYLFSILTILCSFFDVEFASISKLIFIEITKKSPLDVETVLLVLVSIYFIDYYLSAIGDWISLNVSSSLTSMDSDKENHKARIDFTLNLALAVLIARIVTDFVMPLILMAYIMVWYFFIF